MVFCSGVAHYVMNTKPPTLAKRKSLRSFQAWPQNEHLLSIASRVGINVSEVINESLDANLERVLKEKLKKIESEMKLVRGGGFEPPTPTVSR